MVKKLTVKISTKQINFQVLFKIIYIGEAKQKNMCVSGYMLLKIRVGRSDYFFIFWNNFICLKYFL